MMKPMEDLFRLSMREDLLEEFRRGERKGLSQEDIDRNIRYLKRQLEEKYGIPFSKAEGGEIFTTGVGAVDPKDFDYRFTEKAPPSGIGSFLRDLGQSTKDLFDLTGEPPSKPDPRDFDLRDQRRTREEIDAEDREFDRRIRDRLEEELAKEPRTDRNIPREEREFNRELSEEEREQNFILELEERDFQRELDAEERLRQKERQMLEDSEREFLRGLNDMPLERPEPEEPMFSIDTYTFDGREVPAVTFKDGEVLTFPEIDDLFRTYKTAPETNLGPETTRQIMEFLQQTNPTKEQFIRHFFLSRRLADGGEVETMGGIGTLNETAKNMFR